MNASQILSLVFDAGQKLVPIVEDAIKNHKADLEAAKQAAYAAVDDLFAQLGQLRAQVLADDAAAIAEALGHDAQEPA